MSKQKGFTFAELLVLLAILVISIMVLKSHYKEFQEHRESIVERTVNNEYKIETLYTRLYVAEFTPEGNSDYVCIVADVTNAGPIMHCIPKKQEKE